MTVGVSVVLDTNVLVSGIAYPASIPGKIVAAWHLGAIRVVLSRYILDETARVLPRLERLALTPDEVRDLVESLLFLAEVIEPDELKDDLLQDSADQAVLGTFRAAKADYLVTGDKDLLALSDRLPVITPADFWARHG